MLELRLHLLKNPVQITINHEELFPRPPKPDCMNPEYRPFKENRFTATAVAVYSEADDVRYVSIRKDGRQYIVQAVYLTVKSIRDLLPEIDRLAIDSFAKVKEHYGLEELAVDLMLMRNHFDIHINKCEVSRYNNEAVDVSADCKWQLNGHVKQIRDTRKLMYVQKGIFNIIP